ncbi:MAG: alpha-amylase family glycosyl hydrolase, partial [Verrucomicrobiota bacterium]
HGTEGDVKKPLAGLPDFNHDNPEVLDYFISNVKSWIQEGKVTNIRMDTVKHVESKFWHYFRAQIKGEFPDTFLLGEVLCEGKDDVSKLLEYQNYHDFDSIFDFPLCTALRSTFIYDQSLKEWLARPRLHPDEQPGILDQDNPFKGGYRDPNKLVTLLDNHDLQKRITSHARTKHPGEGEGLEWAIRVTKLCLGALFTIRGIPQIYYGTEIGLEGWKNGSEDQDLRRDFPWESIGADHLPKTEFAKERDIFLWTQKLIELRKKTPALKYGTTITLWSDDLFYAFLRIASDDVALVAINNGYQDMPAPVSIPLNLDIIPERVRDTILSNLKEWRSQQTIETSNGMPQLQVPGKEIQIYTKV